MAKKQEQKLVLNQLIVKAPSRRSYDVGEWRTALRSADIGRMKQLYDLFEDILIDGVLSDAVEKRIMAVTNAAITFQNADGEEIPEILDLIDTPAFEELLTTICNRLFWGRSGGEFDFTQGFGFTQIPAKHIKLENRTILINDSDESGIPYADDDHILALGKQRNFGLLLKTAPYAIWKRGGFGDYAQWLEIFGMPQRVGKYSSYDPESRKLLEQALEQAGSAPYVVIPKESEVETTNNTGSGSSGSSYNDFRKACNEEILITILGQTLTTTQNDTGARSLGEVHKEVEEGKNRSDMRYVQRILNQQVLPILEKRGFPVSGGRFVFPEAAEQLSVNDIVQLSDILEIPAAFLHDKYSIPAPKNGESIARRQPAANPFAGQIEEDDPEDNDNDDPDRGDIKNSDKFLFLRLWDFFADAPALTGATVNHLTHLRDGDFNDRLIGRIDGKQSFDPDLFAFISHDLIKALDDKPGRLADIGFTYQYQNDAFRTAQEMNIYRFAAAKDLAEVMKLNELFRRSKSFEEFSREARQITDVFNDVWQKTEYQSAVNIAAASADYHRLIGKKQLFPLWEYKTIGDDKVREEHEKLAGLILEAGDELWDKIYPPNGWRCRCRVAPRMKSDVPGFNDNVRDEMRERVHLYFETSEWKKVEASGFGVNRALMPEIFAENQLYIRKFPNMAAKELSKINYQQWKLGTVKQLREKAAMSLDAFAGSIDNFKSLLINQDNKTFIKDYNSRLVEFDYNKWKKGHKGEDYNYRTRLLKGMLDTVSAPDEVWINLNKSNYFNQFTMIRYYKDVAVVVNVSIEKGTAYRVKTWFDLDEYKGSIMDRRRGLLVYNNKRQP